MIISFKIVPNTLTPVQNSFTEDDDEDIEEEEILISKPTRNKKLARNLKRADRRAAYENYKEL